MLRHFVTLFVLIASFVLIALGEEQWLRRNKHRS